MRERKADEKELKEHVFDIIGHRRAEVKLSAAMGQDAAKLDCGAVLVHTDPITGKCDDIGALAINVAANDVAAAGGEPVAFLLTVILPLGATKEDLGRIMSGAERECIKLNAEIAGGHSEFSSAVTRPVVNAVALAKEISGFTPRKPLAGDEIILTKSAAIEAAVLISERENVSLDDSERARISTFRDMLSVVGDCKAVAKLTKSAYMHDVTEGGVENAVWEAACGADAGVVIYADEIPVDPLTRKLCRLTKVDPLRCLSSGSLIVAVPAGEKLAPKLTAAGVPAKVIGKVTSDKSKYIVSSAGRRELGPVADELLNSEE